MAQLGIQRANWDFIDDAFRIRENLRGEGRWGRCKGISLAGWDNVRQCYEGEIHPLTVFRQASGPRRREDIMTTVKNQFLELTLSAITFVIVLGALALIWPGIIALFLGVFHLLQ